ncbi:MAG: hypothetical protein OEY67_07210 [Gammaproteobacteria bacterium]|nr:hypothetical protein [Gammaproteobacteria bacterium]
MVLNKYFLLFFLFIAIPVQAETESWYIYWALGFSHHNYDAPIAGFMDGLENQPQTFSRTETASDAFGFYWPLDKKTILGFVVSGTSDTIVRLKTEEINSFADMFLSFPYIEGTEAYVQLQRDLVGVSAMRFLGKEIGQGFYFRGDAGVARLRVRSQIPVPVDDDRGYGILIGLGYGFPVFKESRLLIGASWKYDRIGDLDYRSAALTAGMLW